MAYPIRHSSSPAMHNEAFAYLGLDYAYLAFEVDNETLEDAVKGIRALKLVGSNVSMPNKTVVGQYLDKLSPAAELCGSVNTIVNENGVLTGHITDGIGFMQALKDNDIDVIGKKMTIAGAGGAAHLPGMCAALFDLPVIGIPIHTKSLGGVDSLYSIVQMPSGIPVATVAIDGAANAAILAAKMLSISDKEAKQNYYDNILGKLEQYDKNNKSNYLDFLSTYLECNCNINETADKLFVHRNTVVYKINKISEYILYIRMVLMLFIIAIFIIVGYGYLSFNLFTIFILIIFILFNLYIRNNLTLRNIIIVRITDLILILIAFTTLLFLFIIKIL